MSYDLDRDEFDDAFESNDREFLWSAYQDLRLYRNDLLARLAQLAEAPDSKPGQSEFESQGGHEEEPFQGHYGIPDRYEPEKENAVVSDKYHESELSDEEIDELFEDDVQEAFEEHVRKKELREAAAEFSRAVQALESSRVEKRPFDVFCDYHQLQCDHSVYPMADEAWNGAIEIVSDYIVNEVILDIDEDLDPDVWEAYREKIRKKFLVP